MVHKSVAIAEMGSAQTRQNPEPCAPSVSRFRDFWEIFLPVCLHLGPLTARCVWMISPVQLYHPFELISPSLFRRWLRCVCLQTFVACSLCVSHSPQGTVTQTREVCPFLHLSNRFLVHGHRSPPSRDISRWGIWCPGRSNWTQLVAGVAMTTVCTSESRCTAGISRSPSLSE